MKKALFITAVILLLYSSSLWSQTNIISTNALAEQIMLGNYNPATYTATNVLNIPKDIVCGINKDVSTDSLKSYLEKLTSFHNRNSGSDTLSQTKGIGAARRWVYSKFQEFSAANENRLIPSYLQFDQSICGQGQHRNVFAVLPGIDTSDRSIIIIEGHMDSRCETSCDTSCIAQGAEDNGSGSVLTLELARVMSKYSFNHTIVFILTIAEEQGLLGAEAFATYAVNKNIEIKAVQNNDVVGGIICGATSSPPSCPGLDMIDSTSVRIFSQGGYNSKNKGLARWIKLQYQEMLEPNVQVPMVIMVMAPEDRTGRGGDHIPFRQKGFAAIRFTASHEHGDAQIGPQYTDRQHTTGDILGVDTDLDLIIDSFYVNFNYLKRNTVINGIAAGLAGICPYSPEFTLNNNPGGLEVVINDTHNYNHYRIGVRTSSSTDFEWLYTSKDSTDFIIPNIQTGTTYYVSVAAVDNDGIESFFSREYYANSISTTNPLTITPIQGFQCNPSSIDEFNVLTNSQIQLLPCKPNPFDLSTTISVYVKQKVAYKEASIIVTDITGRLVSATKIDLNPGINEISFHHSGQLSGMYYYSLNIDGHQTQAKKMLIIK